MPMPMPMPMSQVYDPSSRAPVGAARMQVSFHDLPEHGPQLMLRGKAKAAAAAAASMESAKDGVARRIANEYVAAAELVHRHRERAAARRREKAEAKAARHAERRRRRSSGACACFCCWAPLL